MYGTAFYNSAHYNTGGGLLLVLIMSETSSMSDAESLGSTATLYELGGVSDTLLKQPAKSFLEFQFTFDAMTTTPKMKVLGETVRLNEWLTVGKDRTTWIP